VIGIVNTRNSYTTIVNIVKIHLVIVLVLLVKLAAFRSITDIPHHSVLFHINLVSEHSLEKLASSYSC